MLNSGSMSYFLIQEKVLFSRITDVGHWEITLLSTFWGHLYLEQIQGLEHTRGSKLIY